MQFHSFDTRDPLYRVGPYALSFQVITLDNTYGLDRDRTTLTTTADGWRLTCDRLSWAGQQQRAPGELTATITRDAADALRITVQARAPVPIRCIKLLLRDLPPLQTLDLLDQPQDVPTDGALFRYPNQLRTPLLIVRQPDGAQFGVRSENADCRARRLAVYAERHGPLRGRYAVELIHEADARHFGPAHSAAWIIGPAPDPDAFRAPHLAFLEASGLLTPWAQRADVPDWARAVGLVLTLHGMHWSGYVFNTYADMRRILRHVAERIDGQHVLALLPGWEGRYYWQYPDYTPDDRLGGADGFRALCDEARALGVHLMPFFGMTCANAWTDPAFAHYGPPSRMKNPTRNTYWGNQPDWDLSRAHDTGWQAWLNIGAPHWREQLQQHIDHVLRTYDLHAVFLDCPEVWVNDPDHNIREGLLALAADLRRARADLLITGEDWWDGILGALPLCQTTRKWRAVPQWAGRYARFFEHIADSEPGRGSTGVFESGYAAHDPLPVHPMYIPTLAFVDGTLDAAPAAVEAAIHRAHRTLNGDYDDL